MIFEEPLALTKLYNFVRNSLQASLPFQTATDRCVSVEQVLKQVLILIYQQPHCISVSVFFFSLKIYQRNAILRFQYLDHLHLQLDFRRGIPSQWIFKKNAVGIKVWRHFCFGHVGVFQRLCSSQ